jgi:hypothetical protein
MGTLRGMIQTSGAIVIGCMIVAVLGSSRELEHSARQLFAGGDDKLACNAFRFECDSENENCPFWGRDCNNKNPTENGLACKENDDDEERACDDPKCPQAIPPDPKPDDWKPGVKEKECK